MLKVQFWRAPMVALALLSLSACGINPMVTWDRKPEAAGSLDSMEVARTRADSLKRALHEKAREQVGTQVALNDALLGLGALAVVAGVSSAHRDVYTSLAFAGGTGYLYSVQNLPKTRLDVYQSGIGAVNCAVQAVQPLQINSDQLREIGAAGQQIEHLLPKMSAKLASAKRLFAVEATLSEEVTNEVKEQLKSASDIYSAALAVQSDAAVLPSNVASAAGRLKSTLETIDAQVNRLVSNTVVDSTATTRSIADLAQMAGKFAPGLGVESFISNRLAARGSAKSMAHDAAGLSIALSNALDELSFAKAELQAVYLPLAARLSPFKGHANTEALKACGVSDAVIALRVEPEELSFSTGVDESQSRSIRVMGGSKPYIARFLDSPTRGLEVVSPLPGDSMVEVRAPKNLTTSLELSLVIMDASSGGQSKLVKVRVLAPAKTNIEPALASNDAIGTQERLRADAERLSANLLKMAEALNNRPKDQDIGPEGSDHKFRLVSAKVYGVSLNVMMTCTPGNSSKAKRQALLKALVKFADTGASFDNNTLNSIQQHIQPKGVSACME